MRPERVVFLFVSVNMGSLDRQSSNPVSESTINWYYSKFLDNKKLAFQLVTCPKKTKLAGLLRKIVLEKNPW